DRAPPCCRREGRRPGRAPGRGPPRTGRLAREGASLGSPRESHRTRPEKQPAEYGGERRGEHRQESRPAGTHAAALIDQVGAWQRADTPDGAAQRTPVGDIVPRRADRNGDDDDPGTVRAQHDLLQLGTRSAILKVADEDDPTTAVLPAAIEQALCEGESR